MLGKTLDAAQAFRAYEHAQPLEETARLVETAVQHERHHAAESVHLPACEGMLGVLGESGVMDAPNLRVSRQALCDGRRVLAVTRHAQMQRLETAQREKAVEWRKDRADSVLQKAQALGELVICADGDYAADHVRVSVQIFRDRVEHDVEAKFQRPLD